MITQKEINQEKSGLLYWKFKDWLKEVRLNSEERDEIEDIVDEFIQLIN